MQFSLWLPTNRVDAPDEFVTADAVAAVAQTAERAGFASVHVTDHPFPGRDWLATGGHHALDPFVALSFAAAATTTLGLRINLLVAPYRNPWLMAKSVASLDQLSNGRVILGLGAGFLEPEFEALGADFATRNEATDHAIATMRRAWSGESSPTCDMLPLPRQEGGPPIWIGGNSRRAMQRAVQHGDGWSPIPNAPKDVVRRRTAALETIDDLRSALRILEDFATKQGRERPLAVSFTPATLAAEVASNSWSRSRVTDELGSLAQAGVTNVTITLGAASREDLIDAISRFGEEIVR
jgi:probable F420-dependent oxidoreductase